MWIVNFTVSFSHFLENGCWPNQRCRWRKPGLIEGRQSRLLHHLGAGTWVMALWGAPSRSVGWVGWFDWRLSYEPKTYAQRRFWGLEDDFPIEPLHFFVSNMRVGLWISPKNPAILRVWLVLNVLNPWFSLHFSGTRSPGWRAFEAFALGAREGSSTWTSPWEAVWSVKIRSWSCVARVFQWFWPVHLPQRIVFIMLFRRDTHMSHFHRTGFDFSSDSLRSEQLTFTFVSRHISWQHLLLHDDIECSWL